MNLCLQSGGGWWEVSLRRLRIYLSIEHILTELILGTMMVFTVTMIIIMTVSVCTWQAESITCVSYLGQAVEKRTNRDLHIDLGRGPPLPAADNVFVVNQSNQSVAQPLRCLAD